MKNSGVFICILCLREFYNLFYDITRKEKNMRFTFAFVLGFFIVLPAFSSVRLPVVNIGAAGVSARSAFGDSDVATTHDRVTVSPSRRVVARNAKSNTVGYRADKLNADILSPNLPSSNLWASGTTQIDTPLRMPRMDEVAIIQDEFELPDETLNAKPAIADNSSVLHSQVANDLESTMNRMAEIDAKIAKLSELQRRANDSVKRHVTNRNNVSTDNNVKVSRTVVPMEEPEVLIRSVEKHVVNSKPAKVAKNTKKDGLSGLNPAELRMAFRKTFLSENKHLSAMRDAYATPVDDDTDAVSGDLSDQEDFNEMGTKIRPFEIKVSFRNSDSALSRENYTLLTTFAGIVVNDSKRAVQILIPNDATINADDRKLTARRLAIVEQVLRDSGISEQRILPVLSNRDDDGALVLRNIDNTQYEVLTKQQKNQFGKKTNKTYKSMTW